MKQLLFLLLFPCLALAQYQGNSNQKITLGEQTTADGLVFRGVASIDTVTATSKITRANKQDTSAYLLLDTVTNLLWHYKIGSNAWTQAGGGVSVSSFSAGTTGLTPSTATTGAVTLGGTLAVANGGTGATSLSPNNYLIRTNSSGIFDTSAIYETGGNVRIGTTANSTVGGFTNTTLYIKQIANGSGGGGLHIEQNDTTNVAYFGFNNNSFRIGTSYRTTGFIKPIEFIGNVGIGTNNPTGAFEVYKSSGGASIIDVARFGGNNGYSTFNNYGDLQGIYGTTVSALTAAYTTNTAGFGTFSNSDLAIVTNNARRITVKDGGEVYVAGTTDRGAYNLQVNGTGVWGEGAYVNGSDANIKENIIDLDSSLNIVNNLKPVVFNYINASVNNDTKHLGFIAQDVYQTLENKDYLNSIVRSDGDTLSIAYSNLIPILTKAIQEQNQLIKALEQRIINLENK